MKHSLFQYSGSLSAEYQFVESSTFFQKLEVPDDDSLSTEWNKKNEKRLPSKDKARIFDNIISRIKKHDRKK